MLWRYWSAFCDLPPPTELTRSASNSCAAKLTMLPLVNTTVTFTIDPPYSGFLHCASYPYVGAFCPSCEPSSAVKRVASRRRKIEAAVEASLGSLDHKCTSVHLAPGGQLCLGYREEGCLHANPGTWRG